MQRLWPLWQKSLSSLATALQWRSTRDVRGSFLRMLLLPRSSWYFSMRTPHRNISHAGCNCPSISRRFWGHPNIYSLQSLRDSIVTLGKHWQQKCKQLECPCNLFARILEAKKGGGRRDSAKLTWCDDSRAKDCKVQGRCRHLKRALLTRNGLDGYKIIQIELNRYSRDNDITRQ